MKSLPQSDRNTKSDMKSHSGMKPYIALLISLLVSYFVMFAIMFSRVNEFPLTL